MKKLLLTLGTAASIAAPIATTVACGSSELTTLSGIGSNSVTPLTSVVADEYSLPIEYTNTGSGNGHASQSGDSITHDFGMMSSSPAGRTTEDATKLQNWEDNGIRTITYAIDAVGVSYNADLGTDDITIKTSELQNLYNPATAIADRPTWNDLTIEDLSGTTDGDKSPEVVYVNGGKSVSGKSEAFVGELTDGLADEAKTNFENHQGLTGTGVADDAMAIYNAANNTSNTIVYHSLGFLIEQEAETDNNLKLAGIAFDDTTATTPPTITDAEDGIYGWTRPFNMLYAVDNANAVELAEWLMGDFFQGKAEELGFVKLTDTQIKLQSETVALTTPDLGTDGANATDGIEYGIL